MQAHILKNDPGFNLNSGNKIQRVILFNFIMLLVLAISLPRDNKNTTALQSMAIKPIFNNQSWTIEEA